MEKFDVVIIGSGPGASSCAYPLKKSGLRVAVIERRLFGGTCPNDGCDPKKVLLAPLEAQAAGEALVDFGVKVAGEVDFSQAAAFKKSFTDPVSKNTKKGFNAAGIKTFFGQANFLDAHTILVDKEKIEAEKFIIATGAHSNLPKFPGSEFLKTSTDFLALEKLPKKIIIIGAGYIAFELAHLAAGFGSEVTILNRSSQALKGFDSKLADEYIALFKKNQGQYLVDIDVEKIVEKDGRFLVTGGDFSGQADFVLSATGRPANTDLGLEKAGVTFNKKGIVVNEFLQTNQPHIFALGDVLDKKQAKLTPVSSFEGNYIAQFLLGHSEPIAYPAIPTVLFAREKLAQVGTVAADSKIINMTHWYTAARIKEEKALVKLSFNADKTLLGAAVLSRNAEELINFFAIAIDEKWTSETLAKKIFAYPTIASDLDYFLQ
ncbi:dihydrolipoyl dehydrogenase family protein [Enterococcus timonensis]|uniref:dihydrolipoyl dehydrogenase family protein n=1 Tax=Enterococcus timonensis TaxID=1852364 RepID=UPI0008D8E326|nr:NAD(P)/FAD-dependent oxidoreductase [Enterococcus timonensis]